MIAEFKRAIRRLRTDKPYTSEFWEDVAESVRKRDQHLRDSEERLRPTPERLQARFSAPAPQTDRGEG